MLDTDQLIGEFRSEVDVPVLVAGIVLPTIFVAVLAFAPGPVEAAVGTVSGLLWSEGALLFLVPMLLFVVVMVGLAVSPWGSIRLGDTEPEFSRIAYFAMFFSAGIAAGIVFWGPAEALYHFSTVPSFVGAGSGSAAAATGAIQYTMFHWGITAWSAYAAIGIPVAYFAYNHGAPLRVSSILSPLIDVREATGLSGAAVRAVDLLAVLATIGGLSTTLGLVSNQFLTGVEYRWDVGIGDFGTVLLVGALTLMFTASVASGIGRGLRRVSLTNLALFTLVAVVTLVVGPTAYILSTGGSALASYLVNFPLMSLHTGSGGLAASDWVSAWTVFYWAWWLSWAPFAGLFLARISKGRTIREVVGTGVGATTLATLAWFVIMGSSAIDLQRSGVVDILAVISENGTAVSGFPLFDALPFGDVLLVGLLGLIVTFFVTSADTSTLSLAMLSGDGDPHPSFGMRVLWGVMQGAIASTLVIVGGAGTLQSAAVITGTPFTLLGLLAVAGLLMDIRESRADPAMVSGDTDEEAGEATTAD